FGIWLIDGPNLIVNIDSDGNISGDTSYTTYITNLDENSRNSLSIYPNPTRGWLTISGGSSNTGSYKIFNLQGKLMTVLPSSHLQFDVSSLPSGLFILEAE
ncbi:T9SS type A sorting domain-containing protein, partial [Arthrospira platensis SPKY1]|nr:T9SS type A sorting domain-containing protein [Arthrospira platensis SPKY1]